MEKQNRWDQIPQKAVAYFLAGYNCAQSVYAAFAPVVGVEENDALKLASPFGGGFGRMREVCGAFSGMTLVLGHLFGYDSPDAPEKDALYPRMQELGKRWKEKYGTLVCRELLEFKVSEGGKAAPRTPDYYASRPCARFVECGAQILLEYLREENLL